MKGDDVVFRLTWRGISRFILFGVVAGAILLLAVPSSAQKSQDEYRDKFKVAYDQGGIAIATSADGKQVYVAGKWGVIVSNDFGKTGSWTQTVRLK